MDSESGQRRVKGSCGHSNETSGSIKWLEFLDYMNYQFLKKDYAPRSWLAIYNNYTLITAITFTPHGILTVDISKPSSPVASFQ